MKLNKIFISITFIALILIGFRKYNQNKAEIYKSSLLNQLSIYHLKNGLYPSTLNEINAEEKFGISYIVDSAKKSFNLNYTSGIFGSDLNYYDSNKKKWSTKFTY